jgi:uncharacterized phiE125 gp8 family phage protein
LQAGSGSGAGLQHGIQSMEPKLITPPDEEPVTLQEARAHLRLESGEDDYLTALIKTARRYCEAFQQRAYVTQTWDLYLNSFPCGCIKVSLPPLQSVTFIKYKDCEGILQTLDPSEYLVDVFSEPGFIFFAYEKSWPATYPEANAVQIRFVAGYGAAAEVPCEIKHAILLKVADLYEHRGGDEGMDKNINEAIESLLWPDRVNIL